MNFSRLWFGTGWLRFGTRGFGFGVGQRGFRTGRFGFLYCGCAGSFSFRFIQHFVGEGVGLPVLLAVDVFDSKGLEGFGHFLGAFEQRAQILALHFVLSTHLLDQELGITFDANGTHAVRFRIVQRGDEAVVFGDVVGRAADVFLQLGGDFAACIANNHAVRGRSRIAARAAVNVCAKGRKRRLGLRGSFAEETFSTGRWRGR